MAPACLGGCRGGSLTKANINLEDRPHWVPTTYMPDRGIMPNCERPCCGRAAVTPHARDGKARHLDNNTTEKKTRRGE